MDLGLKIGFTGVQRLSMRNLGGMHMYVHRIASCLTARFVEHHTIRLAAPKEDEATWTWDKDHDTPGISLTNILKVSPSPS